MTVLENNYEIQYLEREETMKRILALLIVLLIIMAFFPAAAFGSDIAEATPTPRNNPLDSISISKEDRIKVYREYAAALEDAYTNGEAATASGDVALQIEEDLARTIGDKYGISFDDVQKISMFGDMGYLYDIDIDTLSLKHGELVKATITGTSLIIKAKITPSFSKKATVDQNYYNVCDLIRKQGADQFDEIQYWAVADMTDGSEQKVVSFTVPQDVIIVVATADRFADNTLGNYLADLWVHQSLK